MMKVIDHTTSFETRLFDPTLKESDDDVKVFGPPALIGFIVAIDLDQIVPPERKITTQGMRYPLFAIEFGKKLTYEL